MRQHVGNSDQMSSSVAVLVGACSCRWLEWRRGTTRRGEWAARSETRGRTRSTRPRGEPLLDGRGRDGMGGRRASISETQCEANLKDTGSYPHSNVERGPVRCGTVRLPPQPAASIVSCVF